MINPKEYNEGIKAFDEGKTEYNNPYDLFSYFEGERNRAYDWNLGYQFALTFNSVFGGKS